MMAGRSSFRRWPLLCFVPCPPPDLAAMGIDAAVAIVVGLRLHPEPVGQRAREVDAAVEPVLGILRQRLGENRIERRQLGAPVADGRR